MPLIRIDTIAGRSEAEIKKLTDAAGDAGHPVIPALILPEDPCT
jgi:hypothetical protein